MLAISMLGWLSLCGFASPDQFAADKVRVRYNAAFCAGDAKALSLLIEHDGVWLPPGKPALVGIESIVASYLKYFDEMRSVLALGRGQIQVSGTWAFMSGDFTRTDTPKRKGAARSVAGHYLLVLKRHPDGSWKIVRNIWNDGAIPH